MKRSEARAAGLYKYETGNPCSKGHNSPRYTNSGACCKCIKGYQNAYSKPNLLLAAMGFAKYEHAQVHPGDFAAVDAYIAALSMQRRAMRDSELDAKVNQRIGKMVHDEVTNLRALRDQNNKPKELLWGEK